MCLENVDVYLFTKLFYSSRFMIVCLFGAVSKGQLDGPCLSGGACSVANSECRAGVCLCLPQYYHRDNTCRTYNEHFLLLTDNTLFGLLWLRSTVKGHKALLRYVRPSVRPSVCLFRFFILPRSLDGDIRASPFYMHSTDGSTVGYARVQMPSTRGRA